MFTDIVFHTNSTFEVLKFALRDGQINESDLDVARDSIIRQVQAVERQVLGLRAVEAPSQARKVEVAAPPPCHKRPTPISAHCSPDVRKLVNELGQAVNS